MSDTYSSIVTNVGESTLLQNTVNAYVFKLARIEIGSRANLDMSEAMTWNNMESANVVYSISKTENINSMVRKVQLDAETVQFRVTLDTSIGGTSSSGMICGCVGLYLQGYSESGEPLETPFLFAVGSLGSEFIKYAEGSSTVGNMVSFYLNFKITNRVNIDNILIAPTENFSLPTVDNEKSPYLTDYFNTYIVNNYDKTGLSAIAFKTNKNSEKFEFVLPNNENLARANIGGIYDAPEIDNAGEDAAFRRFAYWTKTGSSYEITLKKDRVLALSAGLESDGYYRNDRFKLERDYTSNSVVNAGEYTTVAVYGIDPSDEEAGEQFFLKTVPAKNIKTINDKNLNNIEQPTSATDIFYIFNTLTGFVYETTQTRVYEVKVAKLASFKINANGDLVYYIQTTSSNGAASFEINAVKAELEDLRNEFEKTVSQQLVHRAGSETITGKKTFTAAGTSVLSESILVKTKNPTISLNTTSSTFTGGIVGRNTSSKNTTNLYMNDKRIGIVGWPQSKIDANQNTNYTTGEYLVINAANTGLNVVEESTNVKNHFIQNTLDKLSVANITDSTVYFSKNVQAPLFRGTASYSYWADLAEFYEADEDYPAGTLIKFGGEKDITIANDASEAEGVISSNPGFALNSECEGFKKPVALVGKVPVRVIGLANKGEFLYHSSVIGINKPGVACAESKILGEKILGKVLENSEETGEHLVMCVVRLTF